MPNPLQEMTFKRTVIIGLGSTGLDILHAFQDFWYERFNNTDTSLVKLINIETDESNKPKAMPSGTMITQLIIENNKMRYDKLAQALLNMQTPLGIPYLPWDWRFIKNINWSTLKPLQNAGAGGVRTGGRMLLYSPNKLNNSNVVDFETKVKRTLRHDFQSIVSTDDENAIQIFESLGFDRSQWVEGAPTEEDTDGIFKSTENPHFESHGIKAVVVGSLTGGTSAGMFIDIAYVLQSILNISENDLSRISGIFLIPPDDETITASRPIEWDLVRSNAFGAIYDILHFKDLTKKEKESRMPYGYIYLVAPEYNTEFPADRFKTVQGLTDMVALRMFANVLGYQDKFDSQITDKYCKDKNIYLFSMGTGAILYPKHTLVEMAACDLSKQFCDVLINKTKTLDPDGTLVKLNTNGIKKIVKDRIDYLTDEFIVKKLKVTPETVKEGLDDKQKEWRDTLYEDMDTKKKMLYAEYRNSDGYYRSYLEANKEGMLKELQMALEKELIKDLKENFNLAYISYKIDYYKIEFNRLKYLWELQGCPNFDAQTEIKGLVREYEDITKVMAPTDSKELLLDLLMNLFDKFLLSKAYVYLDDIISVLNEWQKCIAKADGQLTNSSEDFSKRQVGFEDRLKNDYQYSPVIKVFHKNKEEDYKQLKESLIGDRKSISWDHLRGGKITNTPTDFWFQLKNSKIDIEDVKNTLTARLSQNITRYLRKVDFNIFKKAKSKSNQQLVSTIFKSRVKSGFLKRAHEEFFKSELNPPNSVIASATSVDEIRDFIDLYNLGCSPVKNPLMDSMIIYSKDTLDVEFEKIKSFSKMKDEFLKKPPGQPDWTKLRLAYTSEVDFTLIERTPFSEITTLLNFIKYFWFDYVLQKGGEIQYHIGTTIGIPFPKAEKNAQGKPVTGGVYIDSNFEPHLFIQHKVSLHCEDMNMEKPDRDVLSRICREKSLFETLKEFVKAHLEFDRDDFLDCLYNHYKKLESSMRGVDTHVTWKAIFSESFKAETESRIEDIQNQDCLIARVYNILFK